MIAFLAAGLIRGALAGLGFVLLGLLEAGVGRR
jgi:hypothetical protein